MAIAANPKRNPAQSVEGHAQNFIGKPSERETTEAERNKMPVMVRVDPGILERIDRAARRLGISRSAFIVSSAAMRLENIE